MDISKFFVDILNGNYAAPFIIILLIGFVRVCSLYIAEKDKRFDDSQSYNKTITSLNDSLTKLEVANQEQNKLVLSKFDGFIDGIKK